MAENMTNLPPEYMAQLAAVDRQRKLAQLLQTQAMGFKGAQSQGPVAAKTSPLAWLANAAAGSLGTEIESRGIKSAGDIVANAGVERRTELDNLLKAPEVEQFGMGARAKFSQNQDIAKALQSQAKDRQAQKDKRFDTAMTGVGKTDPNAMLQMAQTGEFTGAPVAEPTTSVNGQIIPANKLGDYRTKFGTPLQLDGDSYQVAAGTGEYKKLDNSTKVSVNTGEGEQETAAAKAVGKEVPATVKDNQVAAQTAINAADSAQRIDSLLKNPAVITGFGANQLEGLASLSTALGFQGPGAAAQTQGLLSELASQTLANVKKLPGAITEKERPFLELASAGKITFTKEAIQRLADISQMASHNALLELYSARQGMRAAPGVVSTGADVMWPFPKGWNFSPDPKKFQETGTGTNRYRYIGDLPVQGATPAIRVWDQATGTWKKGT